MTLNLKEMLKQNQPYIWKPNGTWLAKRIEIKKKYRPEKGLDWWLYYNPYICYLDILHPIILKIKLFRFRERVNVSLFSRGINSFKEVNRKLLRKGKVK